MDLSSVMGTLNYLTTEVAAGYMLDFNTFSGATCKIEVWTGDYDPAADNPFVESDSTEDLSSVVVSIIAHGTLK